MYPELSSGGVVYTCNTWDEIEGALSISDEYLEYYDASFNYYVVDYRWYDETSEDLGDNSCFYIDKDG